MDTFELGKNAGIAILTDNYICHADNSPIAFVGRGIALRIQTGQKEEEREVIEIVMNKEQAKAIIKGLKLQLKNLRRQARW